jgi:hypothetical protein
LTIGLSEELNPLWKITGQFITNLNDQSLLNNVLVEHSFKEDVYINLGMYLPIGKKSPLIPKSEFGNYPTVTYTSIRLYF